MLALSAQTRVFVAIEAVDFRCGIDRLAMLSQTLIHQDPMSGAAFVFRNRSRTSIKALYYDGQGYWLCQKRLSMGRLKWWPVSATHAKQMAVRELHILLNNGHPAQAAMACDWRPVSSASACS